ncbi:MAG TPA: ribokinase [Caldilineae bacterium]|nr:ribokinase [Caldilineae bacterium]
MPHIVIVGSLNMDLVVRTPHMPAPGETVLGGNFQTIPGGKGANQAVAAARLGARVSMVGRVGADAFGTALLANLQVEGVDVRHVLADTTAASGVALITVDESGQNSIVVASGANWRLTVDDVQATLAEIDAFDVLVMQLESPLPVVEAAAKLARERGARVALNPAPARALPTSLLAQTDVLIPNESETSLLTGLPVESLSQAEEAARALLEQGVGAVVLTLGSRGALVVEPGQEAVHLPPHAVEVVDTTAAGDAFVAGLATRWGEGADLVEAARWGNAAGALAVTKVGAQPSAPTRTAVVNLMRGSDAH